MGRGSINLNGTAQSKMTRHTDAESCQQQEQTYIYIYIR